MRVKHTPGPWVLDSIFPDIDGYKIRGGTLSYRKGPRLIAVVKKQDQSPLSEDHQATAHLIAAAPDLLEALRDITNVCASVDFAHRISGVIDKARAAISKAQGR